MLLTFGEYRLKHPLFKSPFVFLMSRVKTCFVHITPNSETTLRDKDDANHPWLFNI